MVRLLFFLRLSQPKENEMAKRDGNRNFEFRQYKETVLAKRRLMSSKEIEVAKEIG